MAIISEETRAFVRARANYRCEYCQTQERIVIYLEIDHIIHRPMHCAARQIWVASGWHPPVN